MVKITSDYAERVYAGVLGKVIGVYLGRPFEGWSYEMIQKRLGDIEYYVHDKLDVPLIVTDDDIDARSWEDVIWAMTTRMDPARDCTIVDSTPIDYLDFASPVAGLGSKIGMDATHKWEGETDREWGRTIEMDSSTRARIDDMWDSLGIELPGR